MRATQAQPGPGSHALCATQQDFTIQNIVASCDVKFPIRLEGLAYAHASFANVRRPTRACLCACRLDLTVCVSLSLARSRQYEPELFPGLIYRMRSPKIVLLIFVSGKVVITGGKARTQHSSQLVSCLCVRCAWADVFAIAMQRREDVYEAFENIYPVLTEFRKVERAALPLPLPGGAGPSGAGGAAAP